jgi:hypothetical protein
LALLSIVVLGSISAGPRAGGAVPPVEVTCTVYHDVSEDGVRQPG